MDEKYKEQMSLYAHMRYDLINRERELREAYRKDFIAYVPSRGIVDHDKDEKALQKRISRLNHHLIFYGTIDDILAPWDNHFESTLYARPLVKPKKSKKLCRART